MEVWPRLYHHRPDHPGGSGARFEGIMAAALLHQRLDLHLLHFRPSLQPDLLFYFRCDACFRPSQKSYSSYDTVLCWT